MPFLQFFTTLPANKVPKDFLRKTATVLSGVLKNKPIDRIAVHVLTDQNIFSGSDPNSEEDNAYAILRSIGSVSPDDNRKTTEALTKHVKQELGINSNQFRLFFIDLNPNLCSIKGKILSDLED